MTLHADLNVAHDLLDVLTLHPTANPDCFEGLVSVDTLGRPSIFGGQVVAQALVAGGRTVVEDRLPHSFHSYFVRPGDPNRRVEYDVERTRDGRSFSARVIRAHQDSNVILTMLASFHSGDRSPDVDTSERPAVDFPDKQSGRSMETLLEVREVTSTQLDGDEVLYSDRMWARAARPLPDDPLLHLAALAYVSDLGSGWGQARHPGLGRGGASLDHAMWFHAPLRLDEWVLLDLWPVKARQARGVYHGELRDRAGTLGATLVQEILLRP